MLHTIQRTQTCIIWTKHRSGTDRVLRTISINMLSTPFLSNTVCKKLVHDFLKSEVTANSYYYDIGRRGVKKDETRPTRLEKNDKGTIRV